MAHTRTIVAVFFFFRNWYDGDATPSTRGEEDAADASEESSEILSSLKEKVALEVVDVLEITPDDSYPIGTFCRWYYDENTQEFIATFGTGSGQAGGEGYVGGGEGGQGSAYKTYSISLKETGEDDYYTYSGGDLATVVVDGYVYHLTGGKLGWKLLKFDLETWQEVDRVEIELEKTEGANDQMLVYANDMLIASSAYAENALGADTAGNAQNKVDPTVGIYTHHHAFDLDLNLLDEWILDDERHANGSSLVFVDGIYQFVTTTAYFGDLQVLQYDEDWNFLGSKVLMEDAQWPQGTVYDETIKQYYVAYLAIEGAARSEVRLAIFDDDWNLLSNTAVTEYGNEFFGGRPSVTLFDDRVFVTYDKESFDVTSKN